MNWIQIEFNWIKDNELNSNLNFIQIESNWIEWNVIDYIEHEPIFDPVENNCISEENTAKRKWEGLKVSLSIGDWLALLLVMRRHDSPVLESRSGSGSTRKQDAFAVEGSLMLAAP